MLSVKKGTTDDPLQKHDQGESCLCVSEHRPAPLELTQHHIWPLGMGGPDDFGNLIWICPTTHYNVHEILRLMVAQGRLSYNQIGALQEQPVSRYAYLLATQGYDMWKGSQ